MRFLKTMALICGLVAPAAAGQYFNTPVTSTATGTAWSSQAGQFYLAASSANVSTTTALVPTKSTWTITLDGATGNVWAKLYTAVTGFVGNLTGNVVGNLTGNVTGNLTGTASLATLATTATTATNIAAGGAGQIPYQSAAGTTAMLAAGANTQVLVGGASAPAWSTLAGSTANVNIAGLAARATALGSAPSQCSSGNYPLGIDVSGNAQNCTAAGVGTVTTTAGAVAGATTRFTGATTISSGAFTDNGTTVTVPSGSALVVNGTSNLDVFLSSQTFSAVSAFTLGVTAQSSSVVTCQFSFLQNTTLGFLELNFNGDSTAGHYAYAGMTIASGGTTNASSNAATYIAAGVGSQTSAAGTYVGGQLSFVEANQMAVTGLIFNNSVNYTMHYWGGEWIAGTATPTTLTFTTSGGTMTGHAKCVYTKF